MKILWHCNQLSFRGTEVGMYNYATAAEEILGYKSYISCPRDTHTLEAFEKFNQRFEVILYNSVSELDEWAQRHSIDWTFWIKYGTNDGRLLSNTLNFVQAVFNVHEPHGDIYAYISKWLSTENNNHAYLPRIIQRPPEVCDYRDFLGIPPEAIVFGRHGGKDTFNIPWVYKVVADILKKRHDVYFLFMNTNIFIQHPRVIYVEPTYNLEKKTAFINTCDAMLHARDEGESFGQAIAEFLACNKPVITNPNSRDQNHVLLLGDKGLFYRNPRELYKILKKFKPKPNQYTHLVEPFSAENVIRKFSRLINNFQQHHS